MLLALLEGEARLSIRQSLSSFTFTMTPAK